jgi:GTP-binding protein HflX
MTSGQASASLEELARLVDTAGGEKIATLKQELKLITPATFIGSGKVEEIKRALANGGIDVVVFDDELSPAQNRNLSDALDVKVLDRTAVILDIFAKRARTREGELQVELAQLSYRMTRLTGRGLSLMQQAGYIGNRGPGETRLEIDRRRIRDRISSLRRNLKDVRKSRELHRRRREGVPIPVVSLIGYTNAGKSTLMNAMTGANVLVEDKLFATLDPTVRKMKLPNGREVLIADTVGFIRKLPHHLVESFKATFEEVEASDLLLHVIDASEAECRHQMQVVDDVLSELDLSDKPCIKVYNKCDRGDLFVANFEGGVAISAMDGTGLEALAARMDRVLSHGFKHTHLKVPHTAGAVVSEIYRIGRVSSIRHGKEYISIDADLPEKLLGRYKRYCV